LGDTSESLLKNLSYLLEERLASVLDGVLPVEGTEDIGDVDACRGSLTDPLLRWSLSQICFDTVALAILIHEKKWAPSNDPRPKAIPGPSDGSSDDDEDEDEDDA